MKHDKFIGVIVQEFPDNIFHRVIESDFAIDNAMVRFERIAVGFRTEVKRTDT